MPPRCVDLEPADRAVRLSPLLVTHTYLVVETRIASKQYVQDDQSKIIRPSSRPTHPPGVGVVNEEVLTVSLANPRGDGSERLRNTVEGPKGAMLGNAR